MRHSLLAAAIFASTLSATTFAEEATTAPAEPEHKYEASAELGFLYKTGNTESGDIKTGLDLDHEFGRWTSKFRFDLLYKKTEQEVTDSEGNTSDEFETSDQKWSIAFQTNYALADEKKDYIYGSVWHEDDRFSSFEHQSSFSAGWGKRWYETEQASFFADIGPGWKRDVIKEITDGDGNVTTEGETKDTFIVQAQALYKRQLNEHVEFKQFFSAKQALESGENSTYKSETSITTKLIQTLQLKFAFIVDHNTEVSEDKDNTDTQTAVTLVYSF
ncbi:YdiY family protein [Thalassotalea euphylliae]|uniref:DUF481 domain-containing protein n=1 Tax=Thalassotalea euphylliae TaxID=1655234 RepID=UPI0036407AB1